MNDDGTPPVTDRDGGTTAVESVGSGIGRGRSTVLAIVRAIVRQEYHRSTATRRKRALMFLGVVAFLPVIGLVLLGAFRAGEAASAASSTALLDLARWVYPVAFGLTVANGALLVTDELLEFEARPLLLSTVPDRTLASALLVATLARMGGVMALPLAALFAAFGLGAGSALTGVVAYLWALATLLSGVLTGVVCGLVGRAALYRVALSADRRELYGTLGKTGFFVFLGGIGATGGAVLGRADVESTGLGALAPSGPPPIPIGYAADLLFVGTPLVETVGLVALSSAAVVVALVPLSVGAILRLAPDLWYAEPARPDDTSEASAGSHRSFLDVGKIATVGRLAAVTDALVRRTVRRPQRSAFLAYHLFAPVVLGAGLFVGGEYAPSAVGGGVLVLLGLWLAGAVFCLNPLGEEGAMLGQLVLSPTPPTTLVRARVVAGALVGGPLVLVGTALLGLGGLSPTQTVALGAYWLALVPASAGVALGVGTLLPGTETREILDVIEIRAPELLAVAAHALLVGLLGVGGLLLATVSPDVETVVGGGVVLGVATLAAGHGGYRFAVSGLADHGRTRRPDRLYAVELAVGTALAGFVCSESAGLGTAAIVGLDGFAGFVSLFLGQYAGWGAVVVGYLLLSDRPDYLDVARPTRSDLRTAGVVAVGLLALWALVAVAVAQFGLPFAEHALGATAGGPLQLLVVVGLVLAVNAPVEEALFRNVVQKRLGEALSRRRAMAVATLVFGLVHVPVYASGGPAAAVLPLALVTVAGGGFAVVYDRTENLPAATLCHGLYNATQVVIVVLLTA